MLLAPCPFYFRSCYSNIRKFPLTLKEEAAHTEGSGASGIVGAGAAGKEGTGTAGTEGARASFTEGADAASMEGAGLEGALAPLPPPPGLL